MVNYTLGFCFFDGKVLLIEKKSPEWQSGKLNGIGGKIGFGETIRNSLTRSFKEATNVVIKPDDWLNVCKVRNVDFEMTVFAAEVDNIDMFDLTKNNLHLIDLPALRESDEFSVLLDVRMLVELCLFRMINRIVNPNNQYSISY